MRILLQKKAPVSISKNVARGRPAAAEASDFLFSTQGDCFGLANRYFRRADRPHVDEQR